MLKLIFQGMAVGIANIIPGVSGGTMMVAMGLYDKLIHAVTHLMDEFKKSVKLLIPVFAGAGIAVVLLSRLFEYLLAHCPIPTNFAFCGLIAGSLPFIFKKVEGKKVTVGKVSVGLLFFLLVVVMAFLGEKEGTAANTAFNLVNVVKLFGVGIIAAATMVIPGVSGSMMLMLLGYYHVILSAINELVDALVAFDISGILKGVGVLAPAGIGMVVGIFAIAKLIEFIFLKAETHAYYGILGLIIASPIAILMKTDWSGFVVSDALLGAGMFVAGWLVAGKLGGE